MPRIRSGLRVASSFLTVAGDEEITAELDFNLNADEGIEIIGILGVVLQAEQTEDATFAQATMTQRLHLESGTIEDVPTLIAEDAVNIDTEVIFEQAAIPWSLDGTTEAAAALNVNPAAPVWFPEDARAITARNLTHSAEAHASGDAFHAKVLIYFRYVQFSESELNVLLARR